VVSGIENGIDFPEIDGVPGLPIIGKRDSEE
jgi:hypothetical protein